MLNRMYIEAWTLQLKANRTLFIAAIPEIKTYKSAPAGSRYSK